MEKSENYIKNTYLSEKKKKKYSFVTDADKPSSSQQTHASSLTQKMKACIMQSPTILLPQHLNESRSLAHLCLAKQIIISYSLQK